MVGLVTPNETRKPPAFATACAARDRTRQAWGRDPGTGVAGGSPRQRSIHVVKGPDRGKSSSAAGGESVHSGTGTDLYVRWPDNASGIAIILLDSQRQNHIVAIYGANAACDETQLDATKMALEGADALMLQLEIPSQVSLAAARYAKTKGIRVILDPAPAQPLPPDAFTAIDILTPNQTEAEFYTDIDVADSESAKAAAESLLGMGLNIAVVKMGAQGAYYASHSEADPVPSYEVEVKDTVAAGDAFGTGLVIALCEGKGLPDGVRHGTASGALAVTRPGTQEAMPSRDEVEALLGNS